MDDLKDFFHIETKQIDKKAKVKKTIADKHSRRHGNMFYLPPKRTAIIETFVKSRGKTKGSENRHNIVHLLYNNLVQIVDREKAKNKVILFNIEFIVNPLSRRELEVTFRCIDNIKPYGFYKYTNEDFADKLGISVEDLFNYNKSMKIKNNYSKTNNKDKKAKRDKKILEAYAESGSFSSAAKSARVSLNTAKKFIKIIKIRSSGYI